MNAPNFLKLITATAMVSGSLFAQTPAASTDPVGFVSTTVPAQSDAVLAVPLYRAAEFKGVIQSISGNVLTVSGAPNWTANQFVQALPGQTKTYAVLIASGTKEGMIGRVTANGTSTLTVTLDSGDDLTGVKTEALNPGAADQVDVMPYWTLASLLPASTPIGTEVLGFENNGPTGIGINLSASQLYVFDGTAWLDGFTEENKNHQPIRFGDGFIVRNNSASSLALSFVGSVPMASFRYKLATRSAGTPQDITFGYGSPVPELLSSIGIPALSGDQILIFDNSLALKNKSASQILVYDGSQWLDGSTENPVPTFSLQPGFGYIYRKFQTATAQTSNWQDTQSYLQ